MVELIAKNIKTGQIIELTTDYMFDDRCGRFLLENKNEWDIVVKNKCDIGSVFLVESTIGGNSTVGYYYEKTDKLIERANNSLLSITEIEVKHYR